MKKLSFIIVAFLAILLVTNSCGKLDLQKHFFTVDGGELVKAKFPQSTSPTFAIDNIDANAVVIPGGSNPLTVIPSESVQYVIIGVEGEKGYYKVPVTATKSTSEVRIPLLFSQKIDAENFTILVALMNNSDVSEPISIPVWVHQVGTGKLQVSLSWDQLNDIDLHLVEPDGSEIYYGNDQSSSGGILDLDSNPGCAIDSVNNENITYSETESAIQSGEYIVRVDMYSNCDITTQTHYVVTAYYEGNAIATTEGTNPLNGVFNTTDEDYGGEGDGVTVMKFKINNTKSQTVYQLKVPKVHPKVIMKGKNL